jgi:hypothetical protein
MIIPTSTLNWEKKLQRFPFWSTTTWVSVIEGATISAIHPDSILSRILLPRIAALPTLELSIAACTIHHQGKESK